MAQTLKDRLAARVQNITEQPKAPEQTAKKTERKLPGANGAMFDLVKDMVPPGKTGPKEWSDTELAKIPIYDLSRLEPSEAVILGKQMCRALTGKTATKDLVDTVLFLAVSLRDPSNLSRHLLEVPTEGFGKKASLAKPATTSQPAGAASASEGGEARPATPVPGGSLAERLATRAGELKAKDIVNEAAVNPVRNMTSGGTMEEQAAIYSFLAAFILRAHSRQADSFIESLTHMKNRCAGWYENSEAQLESLNIEQAMITSFKTLLSRREEIMSTWIMWVAYNENETNMGKNNRGMMEFLAGQIYQYTGLHAPVQILAIQQVTKVPMNQLLGELNHRSTRQPLLAFYKMLQNHELVKEKPDRKTYFRYARVWDAGYFHELQSKSCPDLVYLAAKILKEVSPTGARSDPTKIFAIKDLGATKKKQLDEVAMKIASWLVSSTDEDGTSGAFW